MYNYLITPGHGYLIAPLKEVKRAIKQGVEISAYSAIKNNKAYLEEDCDANAFMDFMGLTAKNLCKIYGDFNKNLYPSIK